MSRDLATAAQQRILKPVSSRFVDPSRRQHFVVEFLLPNSHNVIITCLAFLRKGASCSRHVTL